MALLFPSRNNYFIGKNSLAINKHICCNTIELSANEGGVLGLALKILCRNLNLLFWVKKGQVSLVTCSNLNRLKTQKKAYWCAPYW